MNTDVIMPIVNPFFSSLDIFVSQLMLLLPKILFAYILWVLGKWLINLGVKLIDLTDIKALRVDDGLRTTVRKSIIVVGRVILVLIILDTFGIGSTVVGALLSGLVYTIAIALGLAFGKALEPEATDLVRSIKKTLSE